MPSSLLNQKNRLREQPVFAVLRSIFSKTGLQKQTGF